MVGSAFVQIRIQIGARLITLSTGYWYYYSLETAVAATMIVL
jgi:hypothetical protein